MSILHVSQIVAKVKTLFADNVDKADLNIVDKSYEQKIITRCLAAYAIYHISGCTIAEAASSVVDGVKPDN